MTGPSLGARFALATVLFVNAAFVFNNLAPYLGLHHVGALTMFSGLNETADNHFFMPKVPLGDADTFVTIVRARADGAAPTTAEQFRAFAAWASGRQVNLDLLRYQVNRVCSSADAASLELTLQPRAGGRVAFEDACAEPTLRRHALLSGLADCIEPCRPIRDLARRAGRGE